MYGEIHTRFFVCLTARGKCGVAKFGYHLFHKWKGRISFSFPNFSRAAISFLISARIYTQCFILVYARNHRELFVPTWNRLPFSKFDKTQFFCYIKSVPKMEQNLSDKSWNNLEQINYTAFCSNLEQINTHLQHLEDYLKSPIFLEQLGTKFIRPLLIR